MNDGFNALPLGTLSDTNDFNNEFPTTNFTDALQHMFQQALKK